MHCTGCGEAEEPISTAAPSPAAKELDAHSVDAQTIYVHKLKIKGQNSKHDDD